VKVSVRARLTVWFCLVFFCGAVALGVSAYFSVRADCYSVLDNELSVRAEGVQQFLSEHIKRLPIPRMQQELSAHVALKPAHLFIEDEDDDQIYCGDAVSALCSSAAGSVQSGFTTTSQQRILSVSRIVKGSPYHILVASDLGFQTAILRHFFYWLLVVAPVALACSALGGYWLSGRALKPIRGIIEEALAIGEESLGLRLGVPKTGDEVQLLSETLNGMLSRIERAFRQVTEITTNASHELRTPVAVIRTSAEIALLNAKPTVDSHRKALFQICAEAEKSTRLLDSMLMLARAESGVQPLHFAGLSLKKSVDQALETCRLSAEAKKIDLLCEEDRLNIQLSADSGHLNRLWILLLDNAIKYTPHGGRVTVRMMLNPESEPVCEISDNGIGIESKDLPNIFDRFYRTESARLTNEVGSGLGLAIARKIAEAHRASIGVSSVRGVGSVFRVTFNTQSPVDSSMSKSAATSERCAIATQ
jgi:signal transduction histidine kinase